MLFIMVEDPLELAVKIPRAVRSRAHVSRQPRSVEGAVVPLVVGDLEHLGIRNLVVELVVSGQAPQAPFDEDPFDLIAAHHCASEAGSDGEDR